jgi:hypothetical protein
VGPPAHFETGVDSGGVIITKSNMAPLTKTPALPAKPKLEIFFEISANCGQCVSSKNFHQLKILDSMQIFELFCVCETTIFEVQGINSCSGIRLATWGCKRRGFGWCRPKPN